MSATQNHAFQAEIQQVLDIVIHSLYTDREIFVRELVSNAADACEKLRFTQAAGQTVHQPEVAPVIRMATDDQAHTVTITDTGIGMTQAELVENLGTIAHSGTRAFLKAMQAPENQGEKARLIGQFGVGFYSAFMVAAKVEVLTRSAQPGEPAWKWTSEGASGYLLEPAGDLPRGTQVVLHLKEDARRFAETGELERILRRYSNFIQFPIELNGTRVNTIQAIWARSKNEIKEEEYREFYHYIGHDPDDPLYRLHFTADAPLAIQALLFVPARNMEILGFSRLEPEVHLYCRKVLIQHRAKGLLPEWLRFLKGVVDSEDLPLNISRETMQDSDLMQKLNRVLTSRFIKFLLEQAEKDPEAYHRFYAEHQRFIKEGVATSFAHRKELAQLLRFESSKLDAGQQTSLADYVKRMGSDQKEIYYLQAPNREAALSSPYYEVFQARQQEVLFFYDPWDEFVAEHVHEFEGKALQSSEKAELKLESAAGEQLPEAEGQALAEWMKSALGSRVKAVRLSTRLVESPAVVVESDRTMTTSMRRLLKSMGKDAEEGEQHDLEINPAHPVIRMLAELRDKEPDLAGQIAEQLLDNARVAAGVLEDPRVMLKRLNGLLQRLVEK